MGEEDDRKSYHMPNMSQSIEDRVKAIAIAITKDPDYNGFDTMALGACNLVKVTPGRTEWELTVTPEMCNKAGTLHGGCAATILDNLTSTSLLTIAREGFLDGGHVSRTMTMTYLRPVPAGTKTRIICDAISGGRTLAHCRGQIETLDGKVCVTCVHDKGVIPRAQQAKRRQPKL